MDEIISIKEARKLLGCKAENLTNEELIDLMRHTETVVRISVRRFMSSKSMKNDDTIGEDKVSII